MRHEFYFSGYRGGHLDVYLAYTTTCGGQVVNRSVLYPSHTMMVPIHQPQRDVCKASLVLAENSNQEPDIECTWQQAALSTALPLQIFYSKPSQCCRKRCRHRELIQINLKLWKERPQSSNFKRSERKLLHIDILRKFRVTMLKGFIGFGFECVRNNFSEYLNWNVSEKCGFSHIRIGIIKV